MSGESLTIVALSAEVTRLRAALTEIAALQTEEPDCGTLYELGRDAAIRAEVEHFVGVVGTMSPPYADEPFSKRRRRELAKIRAQATDCARWLEEPEGDHTDDNLDYACEIGIKRGPYTASQIARAALDGGK